MVKQKITKTVKTSKKEQSPKSKKGILIGIVDDHVQTAVSLSQMLEFNGYKTFQSYSPTDGIYMSKQEKPNLLLLDIKLDGLSGYDVAKALPNQKILFMTGFDFDEVRTSSFKNAIGVLKKPVDINQLLAILKKEFG